MTTRRKYLSPSERITVRERQNHKCAYCGEPLAMGGVEYDHIIPISLDGTNDLSNFQALNKGHHTRKSVKELKSRAKVKRIQAQGGLMRKKKSRADKARAKVKRIQAQGGLRKKKMSRADKFLGKLFGG